MYLYIFSVACVFLLTEEIREQLRLVVMYRSHTHGVEAHQAEHRPIESLCLYYLADEESQSSLPLTVIGALFTALYTGAGKTWGEGGRETRQSRVDRIIFLHPTPPPTL